MGWLKKRVTVWGAGSQKMISEEEINQMVNFKKEGLKRYVWDSSNAAFHGQVDILPYITQMPNMKIYQNWRKLLDKVYKNDYEGVKPFRLHILNPGEKATPEKLAELSTAIKFFPVLVIKHEGRIESNTFNGIKQLLNQKKSLPEDELNSKAKLLTTTIRDVTTVKMIQDLGYDPVGLIEQVKKSFGGNFDKVTFAAITLSVSLLSDKTDVGVLEIQKYKGELAYLMGAMAHFGYFNPYYDLTARRDWVMDSPFGDLEVPAYVPAATVHFTNDRVRWAYDVQNGVIAFSTYYLLGIRTEQGIEWYNEQDFTYRADIKPIKQAELERVLGAMPYFNKLLDISESYYLRTINGNDSYNSRLHLVHKQNVTKKIKQYWHDSVIEDDTLMDKQARLDMVDKIEYELTIYSVRLYRREQDTDVVGHSSLTVNTGIGVDLANFNFPLDLALVESLQFNQNEKELLASQSLQILWEHKETYKVFKSWVAPTITAIGIALSVYTAGKSLAAAGKITAVAAAKAAAQVASLIIFNKLIDVLVKLGVISASLGELIKIANYVLGVAYTGTGFDFSRLMTAPNLMSVVNQSFQSINKLQQVELKSLQKQLHEEDKQYKDKLNRLKAKQEMTTTGVAKDAHLYLGMPSFTPKVDLFETVEMMYARHYNADVVNLSFGMVYNAAELLHQRQPKRFQIGADINQEIEDVLLIT